MIMIICYMVNDDCKIQGFWVAKLTWMTSLLVVMMVPEVLEMTGTKRESVDIQTYLVIIPTTKYFQVYLSIYLSANVTSSWRSPSPCIDVSTYVCIYVCLFVCIYKWLLAMPTLATLTLKPPRLEEAKDNRGRVGSNEKWKLKWIDDSASLLATTATTRLSEFWHGACFKSFATRDDDKAWNCNAYILTYHTYVHTFIRLFKGTF